MRENTFSIFSSGACHDAVLEKCDVPFGWVLYKRHLLQGNQTLCSSHDQSPSAETGENINWFFFISIQIIISIKSGKSRFCILVHEHFYDFLFQLEFYKFMNMAIGNVSKTHAGTCCPFNLYFCVSSLGPRLPFSFCFLSVQPKPANPQRIFLIRNISWDEMEELRNALREFAPVSNFMPLLNKVQTSTSHSSCLICLEN